MGKKHRYKLEQKALSDGNSQAVDVREEAPKLDFDAWFALRSPQIPRHHHKEILKADFKARGLEQQEPLAVFDEALQLYGVKLS